MKKKKKNSPLQINTALIENYKGVNKYTRRGSGTRRVEWSPEMVDAAFKPAARAAKEGLASAYLGDKEKKENETNDADRIKALEAQIAKMQQDQNQKPKPKPDDNDPETDTPTDDDPGTDTNNVDDSDGLFDDLPPESNNTQQREQNNTAETSNVNYELTDNKQGLTLEQERLAGSAQPSKIKVRQVRDRNNKINRNMVEVNGQEMSVSDFYKSFPNYESMRKGSIGKTSGSKFGYEGNPIGNYEFQGSLTQSLGNTQSPVKKKKSFEDYMNEGFSPQEARQMAETGAATGVYDPVQDLQAQHPNIEKDVDNYIANMSIVGDEKLDILGAQVNSRVFNFSKELKDQANMYIDQEGNSKIVNDSINTLRGLAQKVNNLIEKKSEWIENNGGTDSTKRMFSKGSSSKNKFMQNAIFMERDDLYKMILPLPEVTVGGDTKFGDIEFAFGDFGKSNKPNFVVKSSDLFKDVFMKPETKFAEFRKAANKMGEDSRLRKPFNEYHTEVIVNGLLDSKENTLAFAWDDFAGPSFIEQYREANPSEDISWADVDSPNFEENKLKDEVSNWLKRKLKAEHRMAQANNEAFKYLDDLTVDQLIAQYSNK